MDAAHCSNLLKKKALKRIARKSIFLNYAVQRLESLRIAVYVDMV